MQCDQVSSIALIVVADCPPGLMASQSAASSMSMLLWSVQSLADDLRLWQAVTLLSRQASVLPFVSKGVAVIGVLFTQFDVSLSLLHHGGRLGVRSLQSSVCPSRWLGALGCVLLGCGFWRASLVSNPSGGATAWSASPGSLLNPTSCLTLPALADAWAFGCCSRRCALRAGCEVSLLLLPKMADAWVFGCCSRRCALRDVWVL